MIADDDGIEVEGDDRSVPLQPNAAAAKIPAADNDGGGSDVRRSLTYNHRVGDGENDDDNHDKEQAMEGVRQDDGAEAEEVEDEEEEEDGNAESSIVKATPPHAFRMPRPNVEDLKKRRRLTGKIHPFLDGKENRRPASENDDAAAQSSSASPVLRVADDFDDEADWGFLPSSQKHLNLM